MIVPRAVDDRRLHILNSIEVEMKICFRRRLPAITLLLMLFENGPLRCDCLLQQYREKDGTYFSSTLAKRNYGFKRPLSVKATENTINKQQQESRIRDVNFISPLIEYGYKPAIDEHVEYVKASSIADQSLVIPEKPLLLYLPGFDGTFLSPFLQFPELHTSFDVRSMTVDTRDRSTIDELKDAIIEYLEKEATYTLSLNITKDELNQQPKSASGNVVANFLGIIRKGGSVNNSGERHRSVYLVGESFGGIMALDVALTLLERNQQILNGGDGSASDRNSKTNIFIDVKGLVLINPATCYDRSKLALEGPKVADMPNWLYPFGLLKLLPLFTDDYSVDQLFAILQGKALPSVIDDEVREAYMGRVAFSLPFVIPFMPRETLRWRLSSWLATGCERMASKSRQLLVARMRNIRTLIVAGENDRCLPSIAEAERLASIIPNTKVHIVEGAGHASTCGSRVDLAALFRQTFPELITNNGSKRSGLSGLLPFHDDSNNSEKSKLRTSMKEVAASRSGIFLGMEPRYDNNTIGLSPLKYWDAKYYRKVPGTRKKSHYTR